MTKAIPEVGEKIIVKIKRVESYGVIASLVEYPGIEGYVHISQISNSWIKNIRSFVSEGSIRVGQVTEISPDKNEVNLSLRKISTSQEKSRLSEWRREKRASKLFEKLCQNLKEDHKKALISIAVPLKEDHGDLLTAFEEIKQDNDILKKYKFSLKWNKALIDFSDKNITIPKVTFYVDVELTSPAGDAIELIKKILMDVEKKKVKVEYLSAPKYRLIANGYDYQTVEQTLKKAASFCVNAIEEKGGSGKIGEIVK